MHVVMIITQTPGWAAISQLFAIGLIQSLARLTAAIGAQPSTHSTCMPSCMGPACMWTDGHVSTRHNHCCLLLQER